MVGILLPSAKDLSKQSYYQTKSHSNISYITLKEEEQSSVQNLSPPVDVSIPQLDSSSKPKKYYGITLGQLCGCLIILVVIGLSTAIPIVAMLNISHNNQSTRE
ncbi:unnamed protein product [Didymodactylos carnosus]|uniref:Uncharacterized protein n=1 Tax=Didymodactylos carnosus TaxID=1234261 RepID=A0A815EZK2_9BILA|nr:unnamed protein product [Didymodactylos carnosus]CAF1322291.1 unnamed protein product [Didymodactylos carnosus]CAF3695849.1 unnamed protein product [Didymodactylos carnosus]CAF4168951.1 unnamed protein product [Didymodactylos carnosus]